MKKWTVILITQILVVFLAGCGRQAANRIAFDPVQPGSESTLSVSYTPGKTSPLAGKDPVLMRAMIYPADATKDPVLREIIMKKKGGVWTALLPLKDEGAGCLVFHFSHEDLIDHNNESCWDVLIYDNNGQPIRGAYAACARSYLTSYYMERKRDYGQALSLIREEFSLYPGHWQAGTLSWYPRTRQFRSQEDSLKQIDREVLNLIRSNPEDIYLLNQAYQHFNRRNDAKQTGALVSKIVEIDPESTLPFTREWVRIRGLKTRRDQIREGRKLLARVSNKKFQASLGRWVAGLMIREKQYKASLDLVRSLDEPGGILLQQTAQSLDENSVLLIQAENLASQAEALFMQGEEKPGYIPEQLWKSVQDRRLEQALQTRGSILRKLGRLDQAREILQKAFDLSGGKNAEIAALFMRVSIDQNDPDKALETARHFLEISKPTEEIGPLVRQAYRQKTGDTKEAEALLENAEKRALERREKEILENFIKDAKPAPSFTLKTPEGKTISLDSLRGKTVIVDFWATWCGPCIRSFPFLQKFWEAHRDDPDVIVLAVNTWERTQGEERVQSVTKFFRDNGYTMPLLLDEDDKTVSAFGVEGIPTKFFVGPDGKIYFKDVGFHGPGMIDDMNIELEIIRAQVR
jgi:thiol-disulfide isomerase/thioredoxin